MRLQKLPAFLVFIAGALACDKDPVIPAGPANPMLVVNSTGEHTCALSTSHEVFCWGKNGFGQLGNGARVDAFDPARVITSERIVALATGGMHSCSLSDDGQAWCWGINEHGQIGNGFSARYWPQGPMAVPLPTAAETAVRFVSLTAGYSHTCGLDANGNAYCWGYDMYGQSGQQQPYTPTVAPYKQAGDIRFSSLAASSYFNCGISEQRLFCWGNYFGATGGVGHASIPTLVSGSAPLRDLDGGGQHMCGLTLDGRAYCWGLNTLGEIGTSVGAQRTHAQPVPVDGGYRFSSITAGLAHTCAIRTDRKAMCWGSGGSGELGDGTKTDSSVPVEVRGGYQFNSLTAGPDHTCGVTVAGEVYCWGKLPGMATEVTQPLPSRIEFPDS